jgi:hypothetical protein
MRRLLGDLKTMAIQFCDEHDVSCYSRRIVNHCHFQCKYNLDPIISCYHEDTFQCSDIEQVEKYIAYVAAHEIDALIDKYVAISHEARVMKGHSSIMLELCKKIVIMFMLKKEFLLPWKVLIFCRKRMMKT